MNAFGSERCSFLNVFGDVFVFAGVRVRVRGCCWVFVFVFVFAGCRWGVFAFAFAFGFVFVFVFVFVCGGFVCVRIRANFGLLNNFNGVACCIFAESMIYGKL